MKNSLYPFFWQHGESHDVLEKYMEKIAESGMRGACIEARPHPDFVGAGWWNDMDCIIEKAKQLSMKLWILDDSHFPTGFANGKVKESYPQYLKLYLDMRRYDVQGPRKNIRIDFSLLKGRPWDRPDFSENIIGVYMAKRCEPLQREDDAVYADSFVDITSNMQKEKRLLSLDVPEGAYSIFVVYETTKGGEEATKDYLNPLVKEATQILIDEVYEPHYEHYKNEFGSVIEGFFSDEPRFGNCKGTDALIGRRDMVLPWRKGLEKELGIEMKFLPLLWVNAQGMEKQIRYIYMDKVTRLYQDNFTGVLAKWCNEHGIWYLGHNIEDNGAHSRLGYGTGHYFRGQKDMDFAGIDVIGGQIVPGMNYHHDAFSTGGSNGEFYHYALAKLASSAAHLDPKKKGRAMCEAFGAYGWNEGLKTMKWIADSLLVRGINYIVPHAFNPKAFPDFDCPPHFYAHGKNPQFKYFHYFSDYMNRIAYLLRDGHYPAKVGVLYPAELEWAGGCMQIEKPARVLTQHQIPFDIVTADYIKNAVVTSGKYKINQTEFEVLVVPYGECIPEELYECLNNLSANDICVLYVDDLPKYMLHTDENSNMMPEAITREDQKIVKLEMLGDKLKAYRSLITETEEQDLVIGEYEKDGILYYMFFNENIAKAIDTDVFWDYEDGVCYDAYRDISSKLFIKDKKAHLNLQPYETVIWSTKNSQKEKNDRICEFKSDNDWTEQKITSTWKVSFADSGEYPVFEKEIPLNTAGLIQDIEGWEEVCGTARYETTFNISGKKKCILDLWEVYETAEVFVNGISAGVRISHPYVFDISDLVKEGQNSLTVDVTNTLGTAVREPVGHYLPIEPFGMDDNVIFYQKEDE